MQIAAVPLEDRFVRLEPFTEGLRETVKAALDCDPAAWEIMVAPAYGAHFDGWWAAALKAMVDVRVKTVNLLTKHGKYPIISEHAGDTTPAEQAYIQARMAGLPYYRYYEFWQPVQTYVDQALGAADLPIFARQLIGPGQVWSLGSRQGDKGRVLM